MKGCFNTQTKVKVRFSDTDAMGHVNNARFFSYMEEGRVAHVQKLFPDMTMTNDLRDFPFILADIQCAFKSPAFIGETLVVSLGATEIGNKSFVYGCEIHEEKTGRLVAVGQSVQVMYDYHAGKSCPIPDDLKKKIAAIDGDHLLSS